MRVSGIIVGCSVRTLSTEVVGFSVICLDGLLLGACEFEGGIVVGGGVLLGVRGAGRLGAPDSALLGAGVSVQLVEHNVDAPPALGAEEDRCGAGKCAGNALGRLVFATNGTEDSSIKVDGFEVSWLVGAICAIGTTGNRDFTFGESDGTDPNDGWEIGYIQTFVGHPV